MRSRRWIGVFMAVLGVATPLLKAQEQPSESKRTYVGVSNCKMCHSDTFESWAKNRHARAFELLVAMKQDQNEQCLACHTTGYGGGGFVDAEKTPDLKGITCEACHGPGSEHNGEAAQITKVPLATVCSKCHLKASIH